MVETSPVVAVVLVVLAAGAVPAAALTGAGTGVAQQTATDGTPSNVSLAPGERFAAVVGVQQADVQAEVAARAFSQRVAAAASNRSAAAVVAGEVDDLAARLSALDAEVAELKRAHENGTVSDGQYRARLAQLHARERALQRRLNQTAAVASKLPEAALAATGVNVTAIEALRAQASELTGPEVAAIARSIAGNGAGRGIGGPPADAGPPAFVGNRTGGSGGPGNGQGGPPADAGPGNDTAKPDSAGNGSAAQKGSGSGNGTGASGDAGPRNETGASDGAGANDGGGSAGDADSGAGSESAGDGAASSGDGAASNATDAGNADSATNATDGSGSDGASNATDGSTADGNATGGSSDGSAGDGSGESTGDSGSGGDAGAGESVRTLVAPGVRL